MYVANNGKLPSSLDDMKEAPALPDPYTGEPFSYTVEESMNGPIVSLEAAGPTNYPPLKLLKVQFTILAK